MGFWTLRSKLFANLDHCQSNHSQVQSQQYSHMLVPLFLFLQQIQYFNITCQIQDKCIGQNPHEENSKIRQNLKKSASARLGRQGQIRHTPRAQLGILGRTDGYYILTDSWMDLPVSVSTRYVLGKDLESSIDKTRKNADTIILFI